VRVRSIIGAVLLGASLAPALPGQGGQISYEAFTLPNGLRVIYSEDHSTPIVSVDVWYNTGSRNERPGATGLAHFLEHMMFKGTPTHGKGEFARMVEQNGGQDS